MVSSAPLDRSRNPLLVGGLVILGVGVLAGLAFLVSSLVASNRNDLDLAYLPPDAELIVRVRVAELWEAPLLQPVTRNFGPFIELSLAEYGLSIADIESVTVGAAGVSQAAGEVADHDIPDIPGLASDRLIAVIRTSKALPIDKLTAEATRVQQKSGTEYFVFDEGQGDAAIAAFFPDARTAVLGGQASVTAAIDRGATPPDRPELAFADFDHHLVLVVAPKDPAAVARAAEQQAAEMPDGGGFPPELAEKVRGISLGLTVTEGLNLQVRADCADAASAERIQAELEKGLDGARSAFGLVRAGAEAQHQEALNLVERMLKDARVLRTGTTVELAAALPRETKDVVARLANDGGFNLFSMGGAAGGAATRPLAFGPQGEVPVPPEAVSVEDFNHAWQVELDTRDQPAGDVLASLAESLRLELTSRPDVADALKQPVSVTLDGVSHFAAIEAVCEAAGLHALYSAETGIELRPGRRAAPVAFAGPFVVDVDDFDVFPQYATGHLKLRLLTAGLPPSLMQALERNDRDIFSVHSATGPAGQDLVNAAESIGAFFQRHENKAVFTRAESVNLKDLLRRVDTIAAVRGKIHLSLPTQTQQIRIDRLTEGAKGGSGGVELAVQDFTPGGESTIELRYKGAGFSDITVVPQDAAGKPLPVIGSPYGGWSDTEGQITVTVEGRPASLVATAVTGREELSYDYELRNVPVPRAAERPARLPMLSFAGHSAPVSVESIGLERGEHQTKARLRAVNHSNKDVRRLALRLDYIGAEGDKLDDWPAEYAGEPSFQDDAPPIAVAKSSRAEFEVTAFFMPPDARQVRPHLLRVGFADGTLWEAPGQDE